MKNYVIGADFGTDSVRCLIVETQTGEEISVSVQHYPRWSKGLWQDAKNNMYRQHPSDYIEAFTAAVKEALANCAQEVADNVRAIAFDTTCSTPVLTDINGTPLALLEEYKDNPNAMFILWKDHTAIDESDEINALAKKWKIDYTKYLGGAYSCEWVWAKVLHVLRKDTLIRKDAYAWIEHSDWMSALLTSNLKPENVLRNRCAAGHKAMWHESWGGLPSEEFLTNLDPLLKNFRSHLFSQTHTIDTSAGKLSKEWAQTLGLREDVEVGLGAIDCHIGAIGAQIEENFLVKTIGTSTCDILMTNGKKISDRVINGICGQVDGSVLPNLIGLEAGQSAFGDIYAWFRNLLLWPMKDSENLEKIKDTLLTNLANEASKLPLSESDLIALDWFNGRRTPYANHRVKAAISGLSLSTQAPSIFKALVEATAFGSRAINECLIEQNIPINGVIALGGIAKKSQFVMQVMADVMNMPIKVAASAQACALGAAMCASVAAKIHPNIQEAQKKMGRGFDAVYYPDPARHAIYNSLYAKYKSLGEEQA